MPDEWGNDEATPYFYGLCPFSAPGIRKNGLQPSKAGVQFSGDETPCLYTTKLRKFGFSTDSYAVEFKIATLADADRDGVWGSEPNHEVEVAKVFQACLIIWATDPKRHLPTKFPEAAFTRISSNIRLGSLKLSPLSCF